MKEKFTESEFQKNKATQSYHYFGAHAQTQDEQAGYCFRLWAPHAQAVSVVGDFNAWDPLKNPMTLISEEKGIWELFIPELIKGMLYKYAVRQENGAIAFKSDPYGYFCEVAPKTASVLWELSGYDWHDDSWLKKRNHSTPLKMPLNIYEVHLGSWMHNEDGSYLSYEALAEKLIAYVKEMHYTHLEFLPIMEHSFDDSWGYQLTGYYAATSRYGTPQGLMHLIDACHQAGLGVILDWVPSHFCKDTHGLAHFDGTNQYEFSEHLQWGNMAFDFKKPEVFDFLTSNAYFWFDYYHIDGLRLDTVTTMTKLNPAQEEGEIPERSDCLEALHFLKELNSLIFKDFPFAIMATEDAYPMITQPTNKEGLGFNLKWDMGWMHDTLDYMKTSPSSRCEFHELLTLSMVYAFSENFILPLSHNEVVHDKKAIIDKMFGEYDEKFDHYRLLFGYMMTRPGKKLSFMGNEFAPFTEWSVDKSLEWFMLSYEKHAQCQAYVKALNKFYLKEKALWSIDHSWSGFTWMEPNNKEQSILIFKRMAEDPKDNLIVILNFCPIAYKNYLVGVPKEANYRLAFNSDELEYGGTGLKMRKTVKSEAHPLHGEDYSVSLHLPPSSLVILKAVVSRENKAKKPEKLEKTKNKKKS